MTERIDDLFRGARVGTTASIVQLDEAGKRYRWSIGLPDGTTSTGIAKSPWRAACAIARTCARYERETKGSLEPEEV